MPPKISRLQREALDRAGFDLAQIISQGRLYDALRALDKKCLTLRVLRGEKLFAQMREIFAQFPEGELVGARARKKGVKTEIIIDEEHRERLTVTCHLVAYPWKRSEILIRDLRDIRSAKHAGTEEKI